MPCHAMLPGQSVSGGENKKNERAIPTTSGTGERIFIHTWRHSDGAASSLAEHQQQNTSTTEDGRRRRRKTTNDGEADESRGDTKGPKVSSCESKGLRKKRYVRYDWELHPPSPFPSVYCAPPACQATGRLEPMSDGRAVHEEEDKHTDRTLHRCHCHLLFARSLG